jgi:hypothetical protein
MAASMCPVMSNSPGEGWLPPLTVPPLPDTGVVGVVVPPGPTWMPGGPSPEELDDESELPEGVVVAVALDWEAVELGVSAAVRTMAGEWTAVRRATCASAL